MCILKDSSMLEIYFRICIFVFQNVLKIYFKMYNLKDISEFKTILEHSAIYLKNIIFLIQISNGF